MIDAVFSLADEGKVPVTAELVAERSGVSVASIFRYFDGLDDLQLQTYGRFRERYAPLMRATTTGSLGDRVAALIESRLDLYEQAGAMMSLGRLRALEHLPLLEASAETKSMLADQVRATLAAETTNDGPGRAAELVAIVDALTSLETWDVMRRTHARSRTEIGAAWRSGVTALITEWTDRGDQT